MRHLQLVITAILAASLFQVDGSPETKDNAEFTQLQTTLLGVTPESLSTTLHFVDNVKISDTFEGILIGLMRRPKNDDLHDRIEIYFLEELEKLISREPVRALRTVYSVIRSVKNFKAKGEPVDKVNLFWKALEIFYGDDTRDPQSFEALVKLSPLMYRIVDSNEDAAREFVSYLGSEFKDFQKLEDMRPEDRKKILKNVTEQLHWWGRTGADPFFNSADYKIET